MALSEDARTTFETCRAASEAGLAKMREAAAKQFEGDIRFIIGANGSYARREVTSGSDVDLFFLSVETDPHSIRDLQHDYRTELSKLGIKMPADGGVFSEPLSVSTTRDMIGGMDDKNVHITRRMLLLLEGEWIYNRSAFDEARSMLLAQYLRDELRDEQICLFFLNDVIRYWRTICVDFEFKVHSDGKPRAIRLIKLRFSRLMLFVAGVMAIGETFGKSTIQKAETLKNLLAMPAYQRIHYIAGERSEPVLELYSYFLRSLDDSSVREALSQPSPDGEASAAFEDLRAKAHNFRQEMHSLLLNHFSANNPILAALML